MAFVAFLGLRKQRMSVWVVQKWIYLLFAHTIWYPGHEQRRGSTPCTRVVETPLFHCSHVAALFDISWNCLHGWILSRKDYYRALLNLFSEIKCNHIEKKKMSNCNLFTQGALRVLKNSLKLVRAFQIELEFVLFGKTFPFATDLKYSVVLYHFLFSNDETFSKKFYLHL